MYGDASIELSIHDAERHKSLGKLFTSDRCYFLFRGGCTAERGGLMIQQGWSPQFDEARVLHISYVHTSEYIV